MMVCWQQIVAVIQCPPCRPPQLPSALLDRMRARAAAEQALCVLRLCEGVLGLGDGVVGERTVVADEPVVRQGPIMRLNTA